MKLLLTLLLSAACALAIPAPGLLRVPRVYNALVTSNQNLSPSRAFPVIQPVVHTTAVGYVPPFYYAQFAPSYPGPEAGRLPQEFLPAEGAGPATSAPKAVASRNDDLGAKKESAAAAAAAAAAAGEETSRRKDAGEAPLSFYPSYHSLYYDPYLYSYNAFNAHLAPNPYLFDYQPQPQLQALTPALPPQGAYPDHRLLNPQLPTQRPDAADSGKTPAEKIPDVPPPPVPTSSGNKS